MPRRIGNTVVPRNPVVRAAVSRRGGVHQRGRTAERMGNRAGVRALSNDWREELAFERSLRNESKYDNE